MTTLIPVAVSPLRQRLIDEMEIRRFGRETQRNYIRDVGRFATFLGRSPDTATAEDVRRFQIEQGELDVPASTMNAIVSTLRFFFTQTLDRPDLARKLVRMRHERKLPVVLSRDEVARLLDATTCLKHQAALSVAYGAGLRAAEVAALKVRDIDSERMLLRVERGKGGIATPWRRRPRATALPAIGWRPSPRPAATTSLRSSAAAASFRSTCRAPASAAATSATAARIALRAPPPIRPTSRRTRAATSSRVSEQRIGRGLAHARALAAG
ncbi:site-specific integrase [Sphingomonadaceae bacterium OTU29LAMAA1]|nr:site-specific integrase [Sphingomonadaceae bacterium OTU29LAMAA1]